MKSKTRVFTTGSLWTLLIYLVYSSQEEINNTHFFFIDTGIAPSVRKNLKHHLFNTIRWEKIHWRIRQFCRIFMRYIYRFRWPYLFYADIYGIDESIFNQAIIGHRKYILIEDGTINYQPFIEKNNRYSIQNLLFGPIYNNEFGHNSLCKKIILTRSATNDFLKIKGETIDLQQLWDNSSKEKKNFVLSVFNLNQDDLQAMKQRKVVLLTQPLSEDQIITEDEKISIYSEILSKYGYSNVIIKPHPREKTDYDKIFPDTLFLNKTVPMQLFNLLGVNFETVVTISSTAAFAFKNKAIIDFKGTEIHPNIFKAYGHVSIH